MLLLTFHVCTDPQCTKQHPDHKPTTTTLLPSNEGCEACRTTTGEKNTKGETLRGGRPARCVHCTSLDTHPLTQPSDTPHVTNVTPPTTTHSHPLTKRLKTDQDTTTTNTERQNASPHCQGREPQAEQPPHHPPSTRWLKANRCNHHQNRLTPPAPRAGPSHYKPNTQAQWPKSLYASHHHTANTPHLACGCPYHPEHLPRQPPKQMHMPWRPPPPPPCSSCCQPLHPPMGSPTTPKWHPPHVCLASRWPLRWRFCI
jgi:hypothetical protein